jgi:hypothetical protein
MQKFSLMFISSTLLFFSLFLSCATIIQGTTENVGISSNPSGAQVIIDGQDYGTSPVMATLSRKNNHFVEINLAGYMPYSTTLTKKVSGWIAGNIIFGGLIGLAIDAISGGMYKLTPDQIQAELRASGSTMRLENDRLYITVVLKPKPDWQKIGQMKTVQRR